jgi:hypothetical protein
MIPGQGCYGQAGHSLIWMNMGLFQHVLYRSFNINST